MPSKASLRSRTERDFLAQQREALDSAKQAHGMARAARAEERANETVPTDWCYGSQKLNYTELKKQQLRTRLALDKSATFTYSQDFVSQTVSLVDEFRIAQNAAAESRKAWMTPKGFVYPAPKPKGEYALHPHKPSASRIDMLKEPWVENEVTGGGDAAALAKARFDPATMTGEKDFSTVPSNGAMMFGGYLPPAYARQYDSHALQARNKLPRGKQLAVTSTSSIIAGGTTLSSSAGAVSAGGYGDTTGSTIACTSSSSRAQQLVPNPQFFTSVHIGANNAETQAAMQEQKEQQKELWLSKVMVDDLAFHVGGFSGKTKVIQTERVADILHGPVIKRAFAKVRDCKLPSGKICPFPQLPISALSLEPYVEPYIAAQEARHAAERANISADEFLTRIHPDANKPKSQTIVAGRRKIVPLKLTEKVGPKWTACPSGVATVSLL